jgi:acyl-CoA thioesterase-1
MLIGDSISIGHTIPVREMLKGRANVHRPPVNCGDTARGRTGIDSWLGEGKWDRQHGAGDDWRGFKLPIRNCWATLV